MFFRREKAKIASFQDRLDELKSRKFVLSSEGAGRTLVSRDGCAAIIEDRGAEPPHVNKAGVLADGQIGLLVHGGYQMFWRTPSGKTLPALARQLKALHAFEEDLKEGLGLTSLYNESLGSTCDQHMYDRVLGRDRGEPAGPWQKPS